MSSTKPAIDSRYPAPETDPAVRTWLEHEVDETHPFLLAFAVDGIIWGKWDGALKLAPAEFQGMAAELRGGTLQQAFIFGEKEEVRLFRDASGGWAAAKISDMQGQDAFDEIQLLWGDDWIKGNDGFVHVRDTVQQGMDHIVPLGLSKDDVNNGIAPRLQVRHYVEYNEETGEARVFLSRLVKLGTGADTKEEIS